MKPKQSARSAWVRLVLLASLLLGIPGSVWSAPEREATTMQRTLERAVNAFAAGAYVEAAAAFTDLERVFGREPSYAPLEGTLLPVRAYAELQAEHPDRAAGHFEDFLKRFPEQRARLGFVYFNLARAYQMLQRNDDAIGAYQRFIEAEPHSDEAVLSAMRQAELYFDVGQIEPGIERLLGFAESSRVPESLRVQARLRALQKLRETGDEGRAADLLLNARWEITGMPELAVLAFAALETGGTLLEQGRPADALRALRLVPPQHILLQQQRRQIEAVSELRDRRREQAAAIAAGVGVWDDYYHNLLGRMQGQLDALREAGDYTPGLRMRLGQAFLLAGRSEEAELLFRALAYDPELSPELQAQAHYRMILTANERADWGAALAMAQEFQQRFPDDPNAPAALYLLAHAFQQQGQYARAAEVLDALIDDYPDHRMQARWVFARGHNRVLNQQPAMGRRDFETFLERWPRDAQSPAARLWLALSHFFERDYPSAIAAFEVALQHVPSTHPLYPELIYRRANALYSKADYDAALEAIGAFLSRYGEHPRVPEARVLRGDILMGKGQLLEASNAFMQVTPEAGALYPYAVFQRGKILRAMEEYRLMIEHFENYVKGDEVTEKVRVAEALYWIGWAWTQQGSPENAFPAFMQALEQHGNDRHAGEVADILQALSRLHAQAASGEAELFAESETAHQVLAAESVEAWLRAERVRAETAGQWTWYARIALYLADLAQRRGQTERHDRQLYDILENVDLDYLDARGLSQVGTLLARDRFQSADIFLRRCLRDFPVSPHRGEAYYVLADLAYARGDLAESGDLLAQFQRETPAHPRAHDATLLRARVLVDTGQREAAIELLEDLLRRREARGRPHAEALSVLGDIHAQSGEARKGIAYYQRVYTLYRAYPEWVGPAYQRSAALFETIGDIRAAYNSLLELSADPRLAEWVDTAAVERDLARLQPLLPPEETTEPPTAAESAEEGAS